MRYSQCVASLLLICGFYNGVNGITVPSCHSENWVDYDYFCPTFRYCLWNTIPVQTRGYLKNDVGYIMREWNYKKINMNEQMPFSGLHVDVQSAYEDMGITEEVHNCCHLHYKGIIWNDLSDEVKDALVVLGSDEAKWNGRVALSYESQTWDTLDAEVQSSLGKFCHTRETWDGVSLPFPDGVMFPGQVAKNVVTADPTSTPTISPTKAPTESPTKSPTESPTESPTKTPTVSPTVSSSPTVTSDPTSSPTVTFAPTAPTPNPTFNPTQDPTPRPSEPPSMNPTYSMSPTVSVAPSSAPSEYTQPPAFSYLPAQGCHEQLEDHVYYCPVQRYCKWGNMPFLVQMYLTLKVGYTTGMLEWDYFQPSVVDNSYWGGLPHMARQGLRGLGYDEDSHDCCNTHYWDYEWEEITSPGYEYVWYAFEMLGYDEEMWNAGENPEYYDYDWDELPTNVTEALFWGMCYTKETWDFTNLWFWPDNVTLPGAYNHTTFGKPTSAPTDYPNVSPVE